MRPVDRSYVIYWPLLASLIALSLFLVRHRHGIGLSPDGWAYWQGALSMLEGKGYKYFSGNPILAWPPLYSLHLALWTMVLGPYGFTLICSNALLITFQAFAWFHLYSILTKQTRHDVGLLATTSIALYIGLFVAVSQTQVLAQNQTYVLLPLFLVAIWFSIRQRNSSWFSYIMASCLGAALVLTHNASIVFVAAGAILTAILGQDDRRVRVAGGVLVFLVSVLASKAVRIYFGQNGSHPLVGGQFSTFSNFLEVGIGIGRLLGPNSVAIPVVVVVLALAIALTINVFRSRKAEELFFAIFFCVLSVAMLVAIFTLVWLNGAVSEGRHLLFVPLLLVPLLLHEAAKQRPVVFAVTLCLVLPALMYRSVKWGFWMVPTHYLAPYMELSRVPEPGQTISVNGRVLVGPHPWEEPAGGYSSSGVPQWAPSQKRRTAP